MDEHLDRTEGEPGLGDAALNEPLSPEGAEAETIHEEFSRLLKTYYQDFVYHQGVVDWSTPDTHERWGTLRNRLKELSGQLSETDMNIIVDEVTTELLSLPQSLNLSAKAWELVKNVGEGCEPLYLEGEEVYDNKSLKQEIKNTFPEFPFVFPGDFHILIYREGGRLVGVSAYSIKETEVGQSYMYVEDQEAVADHPGVGLSMLQELVQRATEQALHHVELITARTPLGLGNLGFSYVPANGSYGAATYRLDLL